MNKHIFNIQFITIHTNIKTKKITKDGFYINIVITLHIHDCHCILFSQILLPQSTISFHSTVKHGNAATSIKQLLILKGHPFLVLSL